MVILDSTKLRVNLSEEGYNRKLMQKKYRLALIKMSELAFDIASKYRIRHLKKNSAIMKVKKVS